MILEAIYNGNFYPSETVVPKSEKYRNALKACEKIMDRLTEKLSKEDYDLVEELQDQASIAQCEENECHFKVGFSAGLLVQQEAVEQVKKEKLDHPKGKKAFTDVPSQESTFIMRYPTPMCVWIYWGEPGSFSNFLRRVAINTRNEATSFSQLLPQICCVIYV